MEFFCVMSVGGSLASYHVQKESERSYKAVLRTTNGKRDDLPDEILIEKKADEWQAQPWHDDVVKGIILAIENNHH
jgi:hypothetical protein